MGKYDSEQSHRFSSSRMVRSSSADVLPRLVQPLVVRVEEEKKSSSVTDDKEAVLQDLKRQLAQANQILQETKERGQYVQQKAFFESGAYVFSKAFRWMPLSLIVTGIGSILTKNPLPFFKQAFSSCRSHSTNNTADSSQVDIAQSAVFSSVSAPASVAIDISPVNNGLDPSMSDFSV
jgi:hypothetical protein